MAGELEKPATKLIASLRAIKFAALNGKDAQKTLAHIVRLCIDAGIPSQIGPRPEVKFGRIKTDGDSGDGKRQFVVGEFNDGFHDLRIVVVSDDCVSKFAKQCVKELILRWNSFEK